jgi:hypothetical protein
MDFTLCVLWTFLRLELMCFSLCNDSKTTKFGPSEFIQYIEGYLNKDKLPVKVLQFDFLINNYINIRRGLVTSAVYLC